MIKQMKAILQKIFVKIKRSFLYDSKIGSDRKAGERKRYLSVR